MSILLWEIDGAFLEIFRRGRRYLNRSWCRFGLLSWLIAEMWDGKHKTEEAADTSSAGPLEACLCSDNHNLDDGALKDPEEPGSIDACVCMCVWWPRE